ncbi:MAG: hypothetical protein ACP5UI_03060 [Thermoprotei archaeon]
MLERLREAAQQFGQELPERIEGNLKQRSCYVIFDRTGWELISLDHPAFSDKEIAFLDGGSASLFSSPSYVLMMNRVYSARWLGKRKLSSSLKEFLSFTYASEDGYFSRVWPLSGEVPLLPKDTAVTYREISGIDALLRASQLPRRTAERYQLLELIREGGELVVVDGSLQEETSRERDLVSEALKVADERRVVVGALAKQTSLVGAVDLPFQTSLQSEWCARVGEYRCVGSGEEEVADKTSRVSTLYLMKLHRMSPLPYLLEVAGTDQRLHLDLIKALVADSRDPHMPGYPHGLLEADRRARVGQPEVKRLRGYVLTSLPDSARRILASGELAMTVHDRLNRLNGGF